MNRINIKRGFILGMCWMAYASIYLGRLNLSIAAPIMEQEELINSVQMGTLGSCFFFTYAFGQIINGYLGDIVNPKKIFSTGLIIAAVCNILIGFGPSVTMIFLLWSINGYAQSMIWGPLLKILAHTFIKEKERSRAAMILSTSIGVGSVLAILISSIVLEKGFETVFWVAGIIMLIIGIASLIFIPYVNQSKIIKREHVSFFKIFLDNKIRAILIPNMAHGIIKDNLNLWIPILFMMMYGIDVKQVVTYVFLIPLATLVGRLIFPWMYHRCRENEKVVVTIAFIVCIGSLMPLVAYQIPIWFAALLLACIALAVSVINAAFLTIFPLRFVESNNVASVSGIMDFIAYMGSAIGSVLFGIVIKYSGYKSIILFWIVISVISVVCMILSINNEGMVSNERVER
ncbi:MAG: MFS transporter [Cellulosilyticum sp.]|uniref:MFS transporter n=1 Tax=Zhenhengia sp. TaxID=2944208 RepID=UPI001B4CF8E1|nr:MFS transporter [Cellulosilyticum sp.]MBP3912569.1 MFS transporter [Niameybacter sp.]MDU6359140.1 MFS transporter [Clostridiales bacterium]